MTPERWQQISQLYHAALTRPVDQRAAFLADACADDEALRQEIESLLAHERTAEGFLGPPAVEVAAAVMSGHRPSSSSRISGSDSLPGASRS